MANTKSSFLEKIFTKWWRKKENIPPPSYQSRWDGVSMGFPNQLSIQQIKWMKLYVKLGASRRSTNFYNRVREEVAPFFTKEQLAEQRIVYEHRNSENGRDRWIDTIHRHLHENNISLVIGGR